MTVPESAGRELEELQRTLNSDFASSLIHIGRKSTSCAASYIHSHSICWRISHQPVRSIIIHSLSRRVIRSLATIAHDPRPPSTLTDAIRAGYGLSWAPTFRNDRGGVISPLPFPLCPSFPYVLPPVPPHLPPLPSFICLLPQLSHRLLYFPFSPSRVPANIP